MKKLDVGQIVSMVANVGVIAGIFLLVIEIRQNNELMAEQQRYNRLSISIGTNELVLENQSLAELLVKGVAEGIDQLTPAERLQFQHLESRILKAQEWSFRELPRQELPIEQWKDNTRRESWPIACERTKNQFDPEFVQFVENEIVIEEEASMEDILQEGKHSEQS